MANFHEFRAVWDVMKPRPRGLSAKKYYDHVCRTHRRQGNVLQYYHGLAEKRWIASEKPYFRVHQDAIDVIRDVPIEIPFGSLRLPSDAFAVCLPEANCLSVGKGRHVQSMLVAKISNQTGGPYLTLWVDCGEKQSAQPRVPVLECINLHAKPDLEIAGEIEHLARRADPRGNPPLSGGMDAVCVRLAVAVCALATRAKRLVRPDVLSKDVSAWLEAVRHGNRERRERIEKRAQRRGKLGWVVGGDSERIEELRQEVVQLLEV